jgi:hypothetical protein
MVLKNPATPGAQGFEKPQVRGGNGFEKLGEMGCLASENRHMMLGEVGFKCPSAALRLPSPPYPQAGSLSFYT